MNMKNYEKEFNSELNKMTFTRASAKQFIDDTIAWSKANDPKHFLTSDVDHLHACRWNPLFCEAEKVLGAWWEF